MLGPLPKRTHKTSSNKVKIVNNNYKRRTLDVCGLFLCERSVCRYILMMIIIIHEKLPKNTENAHVFWHLTSLFFDLID